MPIKFPIEINIFYLLIKGQTSKNARYVISHIYTKIYYFRRKSVGI